MRLPSWILGLSLALPVLLGGCIANDIGNRDIQCTAGERCECDVLGNCDVNCPEGDCDILCEGTSNCIVFCPGGGCTVTCRNTGNCIIRECTEDCDTVCEGTGNCICQEGCGQEADAGMRDARVPPDTGMNDAGSEDAQREGCRASCRVLFECAFDSADAVPGCTSTCFEELDAKTAECRSTTAELGRCAEGMTCEDFAADACQAEFEASTEACNPTDGGTLDASEDGSTVDAGVDASTDAGMDTGMADAGMDTGMADAGMADAGADDGGVVDSCTPTTCAAEGAECGTIANGCGGTLGCGDTCTGSDTCGGGGVANQCGCTPTTCAAEGAECGTIANGCGGTLGCGDTCVSPATCGGGGVANACGCPPPDSEGPSSASAAASVAGAGTAAWASASSLVSEDSMGATATLQNSQPVSEYLTATGFGFSIPADATITGIQVSVRRLSGSGRVVDDAARLIVGGNVQPTDRALAGAWPTTYGSVTYGGSSDAWGRTWTAAEINAADFGFALAASHTSGGPETADVDHVTITVDYTYVCP